MQHHLGVAMYRGNQGLCGSLEKVKLTSEIISSLPSKDFDLQILTGNVTSFFSNRCCATTCTKAFLISMVKQMPQLLASTPVQQGYEEGYFLQETFPEPTHLHHLLGVTESKMMNPKVNFPFNDLCLP